MALFSPIILQLALRSLLVKKLQKSILLLNHRWQDDWQFSDIPQILDEVLDEGNFSTSLPIQDIPVKWMKGTVQPSYVSAIAFKLSKKFGRSAIELAHQLKAELATDIRKLDEHQNHLPLDRVWACFAVDVVSPGWIYFGLTDLGLAHWAQLFIEQGVEPAIRGGDRSNIHESYENDNDYFSNITNLFMIQYTHARCCSLLRLAHQEGFIQLALIAASQESAPQIVAPNPLPWLDAQSLYYLRHPVERRLIGQLMQALDRWADPAFEWVAGDKNNFKLAYELSHTVLEFHAACRMWGETKATALGLVQARLGLISMAQKGLWVALQAGMGMMAPLWL